MRVIRTLRSPPARSCGSLDTGLGLTVGFLLTPYFFRILDSQCPVRLDIDDVAVHIGTHEQICTVKYKRYQILHVIVILHRGHVNLILKRRFLFSCCDRCSGHCNLSSIQSGIRSTVSCIVCIKLGVVHLEVHRLILNDRSIHSYAYSTLACR